jgi:hypothetical protein
MKTRAALVIIGVVALSLTFTACGSQDKKTGSTEQTVNEKVVYTCPMHPEVISDNRVNALNAVWTSL